MTTKKPLFSLGQIVSTPGAIEAMKNEGCRGTSLLGRHITGDWGDLCESDKCENQLALQEGFRIMSSYLLPRTQVKIWVITEADRSVTTFLLPSEY